MSSFLGSITFGAVYEFLYRLLPPPLGDGIVLHRLNASMIKQEKNGHFGLNITSAFSPRIRVTLGALLHNLRPSKFPLPAPNTSFP